MSETARQYKVGDKILFCDRKTLACSGCASDQFAERFAGKYGIILRIFRYKDYCEYDINSDGVIRRCREFLFKLAEEAQPTDTKAEDSGIMKIPESECRKDDRKDGKLMWELLPLSIIKRL